MSAQAQMRAMLDQLMGTSRDGKYEHLRAIIFSVLSFFAFYIFSFLVFRIQFSLQTKKKTIDSLKKKKTVKSPSSSSQMKRKICNSTQGVLHSKWKATRSDLG